MFKKHYYSKLIINLLGALTIATVASSSFAEDMVDAAKDLTIKNNSKQAVFWGIGDTHVCTKLAAGENKIVNKKILKDQCYNNLKHCQIGLSAKEGCTPLFSTSVIDITGNGIISVTGSTEYKVSGHGFKLTIDDIK